MEALIVLTGLEVTKPRVKKLRKIATGAKRLKEIGMGVGKLKEIAIEAKRPEKVATVEAKRLTSLSLPAFLLLPAYLLLLASLALKQAFFLTFDKRFLRIFSLFSFLFFF